VEKVNSKNYVLIIDEINRANLPSVLGELIYALEYRGESVETLYEIEGDASISLPENLYIIGTMNTADRSVGHIDYAIKRRFAFVSVLPDESVIDNDKAMALFQTVSQLFEKEYLAPDFDKNDVQLGHSYFMVKDDEELKLRLKFEIVPILCEYVKDGLLLENATKYINDEIANFAL
jgi:5-methylcytosine-specific restriction endonuclease McrBC GTP-binding regulatory subunit McrB